LCFQIERRGDMAAETIPKDVKNLWEEWNIRVLIIFSLSLQAILVVFSPSRKRASGKLFVFLIWFAYLLADWSANYTIGQISDTQDEEDGDQSSSLNHELLAFWAPFLLLHLGGPDTITALALEDNELWRRHLFGLICQAVSTVYVLCLSIPSGIAVPTGLMIVAGVIKFVERIRALYLASSGKFKGSYAYKLFNISKGLVLDLRLASRGWDESKRFVDSLTPEEALRVLEVELSFMYDDFFTKASILLTRVGSVFRFIAFGCLVSSLCIFFSKKKENYKRFDVSLTYALLIGGIVLELVLNRRFMFRRWSEYIHGYNLIEFCLRIIDYGQSILLWHIATDLIYRIEIRILTEEQYRCKEVSKMLSDYMMYLMMMKPALMSAVAGTAKMKFTETCSVARTFFGDGFSDVREACGELLSKKRNMMVFYMGDESTLEDACKLAEELLRIERRSEEVSVWGLVSRVWVELLCYAANHCDSKQHVAQLSQGGELVSFVWLFMAHLGIGKHATMHHPA
ncbi:hypothetical protein HID58_081252, partial [Brassica napus]